MDIPPEYMDTFKLLYRGIKELSVELVTECHDPDYETTLANVRRRISEMEERTFQLTLFYDGSSGPRAGKAAA